MKDKRIITIISAVVLVIAVLGLSLFLNGNKKEEVKVNSDAKIFDKEYETLTEDNQFIYKNVD